MMKKIIKYTEALSRINNTLDLAIKDDKYMNELKDVLKSESCKRDLDLFNELMFLIRTGKVKIKEM